MEYDVLGGDITVKLMHARNIKRQLAVNYVVDERVITVLKENPEISHKK